MLYIQYSMNQGLEEQGNKILTLTCTCPVPYVTIGNVNRIFVEG